MAVELAELVERLDVRRTEGDTASVVLTSVVHDSRAVSPGALFCCVPGTVVDGHDMAAAAVEAGAVALLCERPVAVGVPQVVVADVRSAMGAAAAAFHGDPSHALTVVGVTGTNGKTTTSHLLAAILEADGRTTGVIGNLTAVPGGPPNTPEGPELQARLAAMRDGGATAAVMEVSSHALAQGRVTGTRFRLAIFTNLTPDHLDHHGTMEAYFAAKARLFEPALSDAAVVNTDDPHGKLLLDAAVIPTEAFRLADATEIEATMAGTSFRWRGQHVHLPLPGRFNLANALGAATAAAALGVGTDAIAAGLGAVRPIPGRFELVVPGAPVQVVVDYAHTPDGLRQLLSTVRALVRGGRIHVVFGCGGDRDRTKRPAMGAIAAALADHVVVTSDNPRGEDPLRIIREVVDGAVDAGGSASLEQEVDRRRAIAAALRAAEPGDVVVIAGKGHEVTQVIGRDVVPFDDREVARELMAEMGMPRAGAPSREDGAR